jgi:hypothetical protein
LHAKDALFAQKKAAADTAVQASLVNPSVLRPISDSNVTVMLWFAAGSQNDPPGSG